ncbi:hypothetical protein SPRG_04786 [Saprolegnia parasitica CBS 223.65]|uniref:Tail specific protease domain-containing protein n=1 Tax=Saprolegnia parasitica (strain CBS 223.65) TaxID=695850 RepID=A0A067CJG9_SAPPC|nr:hypothetical protein SPRG_04786 [Saprolegnia parasitica CBS 223.65]KDO30884.1 hypothetical protein SPRG_04786 [Saprolegnia parasitica CBS 223.65]|eukprot:XP_012198578.1 hypothetical protein SPRG_04786 [Saprolegnia parasitica CBS 223.65]
MAKKEHFRYTVSNLIIFLFPPFRATRSGFLNLCFLYPLQWCESLLIQPTSRLRRHMPLLGGICVICLTLGSMLLRSAWQWLHDVISGTFSSTDAKVNFEAFWSGIYHDYAFLEGNANWSLVHRLFGDKIDGATTEHDLWTALVDSIALLDDPCVTISNVSIPNNNRVRSMDLDGWVRDQLDNYNVIANQFTWGVVRHSRPIGYLSLSALEGFVELQLPFELRSCGTRRKPCTKGLVPEMYDLEAMRWAMEAIVTHLHATHLHGLILDLRHSTGGGSYIVSLVLASFFKPPSFAFIMEERLQKRQFHVPTSRLRYDGPLAILQGADTARTSELLLLALLHRPKTCRLGAKTAGRLSDVREMSLPNGWVVDVPYQRCYGEDGKQYQKTGIPPQKALPEPQCWAAALEYLDREWQHTHNEAASS